MSEENYSYRQILRATSIIGGASVINVLVGLLRTKAAALLLGPTGVGLVGLLQNLIAAVAVVSALGFGSVGARQIAEAAGRGDEGSVAAARRAIFWGTLIMAVVGTSAFWLLRDTFAKRILGDPSQADDIGWLALGVGLTVAAGSQAALFSGLRRIGDIGRVTVSSAVLSTVLGIAALWLWGSRAVPLFILATPFSSFVIGALYAARLPRVQTSHTPWPQLMVQWRGLVRLGIAFTATGLIATSGQLVVRTIVQHRLGSDALGQFQAAWVISMTYISFVLSAMSTDYYPRLTASIYDHAAVNRMVNEQTEVALYLAGPVFLAMIATAPWVIELLNSSKFAEAAVVLRWQVLGDILRLACWPMGFIILASGDGRAFMLTESLATGSFVALTWIGLPYVGVQATGLAFIGMYATYLSTVHWLSRRKTRFAWNSQVQRYMAGLFAVAAAVCILANFSKLSGFAIGIAATLAAAIYSFSRLGHMVNLTGPLGRVAAVSRTALMKLGMWHD